jgi:hypothetical protein
MQDYLIDRKRLQADMLLPWVMVAIMAVVLAAWVLVCQILGERVQQPLPETQREVIRTVLYAIAIATFPLTNLLRHIQLRLNQTMPLSGRAYQKAAKSRYLLTVIISMSLIQTIGIFGFIMFVLGDSFNTLIIFTVMAALGLFLYRPKWAEYAQVMAALAGQTDE